MAEAIGGVRVELSADTVRLVEGLREGAESVKQFAAAAHQHNARAASAFGLLKNALGAVGVGLSVGGIVAFGKHLTAMADDAGTAADALGLTVEKLSQLNFASKAAGVGASGLFMSMKMLNDAIGQAQAESPKAIELFLQLGLSFENLAKMPADERLLAVVDALSLVQDTTVRTRLALELMGMRGEHGLRLVAEGAKGLKEGMLAADAAGATITKDQAEQAKEQMRSWDELAAAIEGWGRTALGWLGDVYRVAKEANRLVEEALAQPQRLNRMIEVDVVTKEPIRQNRVIEVEPSIPREDPTIKFKALTAAIRENALALKINSDQGMELSKAIGMANDAAKRWTQFLMESATLMKEKRFNDAYDVQLAYDKAEALRQQAVIIDDLNRRVAEQNTLFEQGAGIIASGFADAIMQGKNFADTLRDISKNILQMILYEIILQQVRRGLQAAGLISFPIGDLRAGPAATGAPATTPGTEVPFSGVPAIRIAPSGGGSTTVINNDFRGADPTIIPRVEAMMRQAAPQIVAMSVAAVESRARRT
ncbi:MAG: hypothetical protein HY323_07275 [Betaproteobacteria bacterium]|nr:hypothetical protein [Betaproteobacteria bacterium]